MDINSYQSYEEPRTANAQTAPIKSIQGWKNRKTQAQNEIIATLSNANETRTASFNKTLMGYAPQKIPTSESGQNKEAFQFGDIVDVVNPLHHLPIVGTLYRNITGDKLHPIAGIIGGGIYGGPIGAITGTANAISKVQTGKDIGERALAIFKPNNETQTTNSIIIEKQVQTATNTTKPYSDDVTTLTLAAMPPSLSF